MRDKRRIDENEPRKNVEFQDWRRLKWIVNSRFETLAKISFQRSETATWLL